MLFNRALYMGCRLILRLWCMLFHASSTLIMSMMFWCFIYVISTFCQTLKLNRMGYCICVDMSLFFEFVLFMGFFYFHFLKKFVMLRKFDLGLAHLWFIVTSTTMRRITHCIWRSLVSGRNPLVGRCFFKSHRCMSYGLEDELARNKNKNKNGRSIPTLIAYDEIWMWFLFAP